MPLTENVLSLLQSQATLDQTRAQTQSTEMLTQYRGQEMQAQQRAWQAEDTSRTISAQFYAQRSKDMNRDAPGTPIADQAASNPIVEMLSGEVSDDTRRQKDAEQLAEKNTALGGDLKTTKMYQDQAKAAESRRVSNQQRLGVLQKDAINRVSSIAGSYDTDTGNLDQVVSQLNDVNPKILEQAKLKGLVDVDATGAIAPTKRTEKYFDTLQRQGESAGKQADLAAKAATLDARAADLARKETQDKVRELEKKVDQNLRREGLDIQRDNADTRRDSVDSQVRAREARDKRLTVAADKAKDPSSTEAKASANYLKANAGMTDADAGQAAYDFLRKKLELHRDDPSKSVGDITDEATDWIKGRMQPGKTYDTYWGFGPSKTDKGSYGNSGAKKDDFSSVTDADKKANAKGEEVSFSVFKNGARADGTGDEASPFKVTDQKQIDGVPSGKMFIVDGKVYRKK